jgi:uncharacterized protein YbjT (DUF2867 family)
MSEPRRVLLAGATGLVGTSAMQAARAQPSLRLIALTRREAPIPRGTRMEMMVADPASWPEAVAAIAPEAVICSLGTTRRKAGSEAAFRAVDHDLVVRLASAAKAAGASHFVLVSSAGANALGKAFYLRVKAEVETALTRLKFRRLDILRPGLLRGPRANERRPLERLALLASPLADLLLHGDRRRYRSIDARTVAAAALQLTREKAAGRFVHENESIVRAARRLDG